MVPLRHFTSNFSAVLWFGDTPVDNLQWLFFGCVSYDDFLNMKVKLYIN